MKLATRSLRDRTVAVRVDGDTLVELGYLDVGAVLADPGGLAAAATADGPRHDAGGATFATLVPHSTKVVGVGLNYRDHIQEMGRVREWLQGKNWDATTSVGPYLVTLVEGVSTMIRLNSGDMIATGTPGGVGHTRKPPVYLTGGETVTTEIEGLGRPENHVVVDGR